MGVMASAHRRGRPSRTKNETLEIRKRIVDLSNEGYTEQAIAAEIGFAPSAIHQHLAVYRESLAPSTKLAEEWRQTKLARHDERFRRLGAKALGKQDEHGNWIVEPDYQALTALQREQDSITKLLGANLEVGMSLNFVPSREQFAVWLGYDPQEVIEGVATEEPT